MTKVLLQPGKPCTFVGLSWFMLGDESSLEEEEKHGACTVALFLPSQLGLVTSTGEP